MPGSACPLFIGRLRQSQIGLCGTRPAGEQTSQKHQIQEQKATVILLYHTVLYGFL
jgi:hypothetical protein